MIEKNIMQTWKNEEIPKHWRKSRPSIQKYMGDYKYHFMTDKDNLRFVKKYFPDFYDTFINFKYDIMRADAIRIMWLYIHGGIYCDMDMYLKKDLSKLIKKDKKLVFVEYNSVDGKNYTNSLMMSEKRNPFWLKVMKEMKKPKPWRLLRCQEVYETTGPYFLSDMIRKYKPADMQVLKFEKLVGKSPYIKNVEGKSWHGPIENIGVFFHDTYKYALSFF